MRKQTRIQTNQGGSPRPPMEAQEPAKQRTPQLQYGRELRVATLNIRGLKHTGKREEVEKLMNQNATDIMCLQETHTAMNSKEKRKDYTWYLNGAEDTNREYAGMAFVVKNEINKYVDSVIPHSNRLAEIRIRGSVRLMLLNIYAPQSGKQEEEKKQFYAHMKRIISHINKKGPYIVMGDFNARLQEAEDEEES